MRVALTMRTLGITFGNYVPLTKEHHRRWTFLGE